MSRARSGLAPRRARGARPRPLAGGGHGPRRRALPDPQPRGRRRRGSWQAENNFRLSWDPLPAGASREIDAVDYLVRDGNGNALGPTVQRASDARNELDQASIPSQAGPGRAAPGTYKIEVWFETDSGDGPRASTTLRFDDTRPGSARALSPAGWIARRRATSSSRSSRRRRRCRSRASAATRSPLDHGSGALPCAGAEQLQRGGDRPPRRRRGRRDLARPPRRRDQRRRRRRRVRVGAALRARRPDRSAVDGNAPRIAFSAAPSGWSDHPVRISATASDPSSGIDAAGPNGPLTSIAVDGGVPTVATGARSRRWSGGDGVHRVESFARDAVGNSGEARPDSTTVKVDETRADRCLREYPGPAGTGADRGDGDRLALRPQRRRRLDRLPAGRVGAAVHAAPDQRLRRSAERALGLRCVPAGSYEFRLTGFDAAGNSARSGQRQNGARMVLANPLKRPTAIEFGFGGRKMIWHRCRAGT